MSTPERMITKPTLAFFGATGGCCNAALVLALNNGYHCSALARTPSNLTSLLLAKNVSSETLSTYLHITHGDVKDPSAVRQALVLDGTPVSQIFSGIGMIWNKRPFDTSICATATRTIISALKTLAPSTPPSITVISTTGISKLKRDVPLLCIPLYKLMLHIPHQDKRLQEDLLDEAAKEGIVAAFTAVRPSLLTSGEALGKGVVRVGVEEKPMIGYTVSRDDVGGWLFEELVQGSAQDRWRGQKVTLTY